MTANKDLKRLVRARMKKTGEAYTTARAQLTRKKAKASAAEPVAPSPSDYATLAGISDDVIKKNTGCGWEKWVRSLDYHGAATLPHREIAEIVRTKYKVGDWWTQYVTVGYERIKGLRERGQRRDGTYEVSKSRTVDVSVKELFEACINASARRKWLDETGVTVRTATPPKSMRIRWHDGTIVVLGFTPKGEKKSSVSVQHSKLPSKAIADELKAYWARRLDALVELLTK
jgi:hypothetical protein